MTLNRRDSPTSDSLHIAMNAVGGLYIVPDHADPQEVRTEVLSRRIRALEIFPGASIECIRGLPLEFLVVSYTDSVEAIGTLQGLRGLHLGSWTGQLQFEALPLLEWFDTTEPEPGQLDPLLESANERLHHLAVGRYPFTDATPLRALKHLTHLAIGDSRTLANVEGLRDLTHLRHLSLYICPKLDSLAGLEAAHRLQHIEIENCNQITDLSPLAGLARLRSIKIEMRTPPTLVPLMGHRSLEYIWLVTTKRPSPDVLEPILASPRLRYLAAGRSCWLRDEGSWEYIPNIYSTTSRLGVLHERFVDEYQAAAAW